MLGPGGEGQKSRARSPQEPRARSPGPGDKFQDKELGGEGSEVRARRPAAASPESYSWKP